MTLPVSAFPVTAGAAVVGLGTVAATVGFGDPCRGPGEVLGPDVEGRALARDGLGVGVGVRVGTGELAEPVVDGGAGDAAGCAATDACAADAAAELAAAEPAAAVPAAEVAAAALAAAAELTATELPDGCFRSAGFVEFVQAASAEKAPIARTTLVRRAV